MLLVGVALSDTIGWCGLIITNVETPLVGVALSLPMLYTIGWCGLIITNVETPLVGVAFSLTMLRHHWLALPYHYQCWDTIGWFGLIITNVETPLVGVALSVLLPGGVTERVLSCLTRRGTCILLWAWSRPWAIMGVSLLTVTSRFWLILLFCTEWVLRWKSLFVIGGPWVIPVHGILILPVPWLIMLLCISTPWILIIVPRPIIVPRVRILWWVLPPITGVRILGRVPPSVLILGVRIPPASIRHILWWRGLLLSLQGEAPARQTPSSWRSGSWRRSTGCSRLTSTGRPRVRCVRCGRLVSYMTPPTRCPPVHIIQRLCVVVWLDWICWYVLDIARIYDCLTFCCLLGLGHLLVYFLVLFLLQFFQSLFLFLGTVPHTVCKVQE